MAAKKGVGTVEWVDAVEGRSGHWKARIRLASGERPWVHLHDANDPTDEPGARAKAAAMGRLAKSSGWRKSRAAKRAPSTETAAKWFERYFNAKEAKGHSTVDDARGRVKNYVLPVIGHLVMAEIEPEDLEAVVAKIDAAIESGAIAWKTGANVWGDVTAAFGVACRAKDPTLRVRADNPTKNVAAPERGEEAEKPILFPSEFLALVSHEETPLDRRRLYTVGVYLAARANEIQALTAADVNLVHQKVTINKQRDRKTDGEKKTKTKRSRVVDIEPALIPLLAALVKERPVGRLFDDPPSDEERAKLLRADLLSAGVARAELHVAKRPRVPMWFHHLRDTGLTWMAVRGDEPMRIQWRGGHTDFKTTQRYIAQGKNLAGGFGKPFPALPSTLNLAEPVGPTWTTGGGGGEMDQENVGVPNGIRSRGNAYGAVDRAESRVDPGGDSLQKGTDLSGPYGLMDQVGPSAVRLAEDASERDLAFASTVRAAVDGALAGNEAVTLLAMESAFEQSRDAGEKASDEERLSTPSEEPS